jgi:hypothetical protein
MQPLVFILEFTMTFLKRLPFIINRISLFLFIYSQYKHIFPVKSLLQLSITNNHYLLSIVHYPLTIYYLPFPLSLPAGADSQPSEAIS